MHRRRTLSGMMMLGLAVMGCGPETTLEEPTGTARFALTSAGADGATYRLNGAQIAITGPQSMLITDTSMDTLSLSLPAGDYEARLEGNWSLERTDAPTVPVKALMVSPNPLSFTVKAKSTVSVRFLFEVRVGSADVGIAVGNGGWVTGTFTLQTRDPGGPHRVDALLGHPIRFTVAYDVGSVVRSDESSSNRYLTINANSVTAAQFSGVADATLQESLPGGLVTTPNNPPAQFSLTLSRNDERVTCGFDAWSSSFGTTVEFGAWASEPVMGTFDARGYPTLDPVTVQAQFRLRLSGVTAEGAGTLTVVPQ